MHLSILTNQRKYVLYNQTNWIILNKWVNGSTHDGKVLLQSRYTSDIVTSPSRKAQVGVNPSDEYLCLSFWYSSVTDHIPGRKLDLAAVIIIAVVVVVFVVAVVVAIVPLLHVHVAVTCCPNQSTCFQSLLSICPHFHLYKSQQMVRIGVIIITKKNKNTIRVGGN